MRVRVANETDGERAVLLDADRLGITASQEAGTSVESVEGLPPGPVDVECTAPGTAEQPATLAHPVRVEVVDADGLWQRTAVECPQGDEIGIPILAGWSAMPALTREQLPDELGTRTRLAPDDEISRSGYPEQDDAPLVVVRNDRVVISATPVELDGRWDLAEVRGCESDGLLAPEAAGEPGPVVQETTAGSEPLPDVMEVRCTDEGTTVSTPAVKPGPAGVRVRIANDTGKPIYVTVESANGGRGDQVAEQGRDTVEPLPPGPVSIACYDPNDPAQDPPSSPGYLERVEHFEVVDEDGLWITDRPECPDGQMAGASASFGEDAGQPREELPDMLRTWLKLLPTDEVRSAGYPEQPNAPLVVVRDGRVVARGFDRRAREGLGHRFGRRLQLRRDDRLIPIPGGPPVPYDPAPCLRSRSLSCPVTASDPR